MKELGKLKTLIKNPKALYNIGVGPLPKNEAQLFKTQWPKIKVYGCEPHEATFNSRIQDYPGIIWRIACGNPGERTFHLSPEPAMSSVYHIPKVTTQTTTVNCVSLDKFDFMAGKQDDIVLWVDVEGAESEVLDSGPKLLSSGRVHYINIEVRTLPRNPEEEHNLKRLPEIMKEYGFTRDIAYRQNKTHHDELWSKA